MSESALIKEATAFVEEILEKPLGGPFGEALKDGVLLCEFCEAALSCWGPGEGRMWADLVMFLTFVAVNKLKPGSVKKFKASKMAFVCMENIAAYTEACKAIGVPDEYNFVTVSSCLDNGRLEGSHSRSQRSICFDLISLLTGSFSSRPTRWICGRLAT
jgi:hypothetical protein